MRKRRDKRKRRNKIKYTKEINQYLQRWDRYFEKDEYKFLKNCTDEKKLSLLRWFEDHIKNKVDLIWMLECGLVYSIDRKNMEITEIVIPNFIMRKLNNSSKDLMDSKIKRLTEGGGFAKERGLGDRDWHKAAFRFNNNFFFAELGYKVGQIHIAPGWHHRAGLGAIVEDMGHDLDLQVLFTRIQDYRNEQIAYILERLHDILKKKYRGSKIYDAPLKVDTNGIKWNKELYYGEHSQFN